MAFEWIPFLIALIAALWKLWSKEKFTATFIVVTTILSTVIGIVIAFIGGVIFPAEATTMDTSLLLTYLWSSFVGAIIPPIVEYIGGIKFE